METFEKGGCILVSGTAKTSKDHVQGLARARRKMQLSSSARALLAYDLLIDWEKKAKLERHQAPTSQGQSSGRHLVMDPDGRPPLRSSEKHRAGIPLTCTPSASDVYRFL